MLLLRRFIIFCFLQIFYAPKNFRKKMILISHSHKIFFAVLDLSVVVVSLGSLSLFVPPPRCRRVNVGAHSQSFNSQLHDGEPLATARFRTCGSGE